jgi:citronellol/citronellal dehydrogenase
MVRNAFSYALSKYGMTILTLGMAEEFRQYGISCNTLWPETYIATAAVSKNLGEENTLQLSRKPEIMADAAYAIYTTNRGELTGQSLTDEQALARIGITELLAMLVLKERWNYKKISF